MCRVFHREFHWGRWGKHPMREWMIIHVKVSRLDVVPNTNRTEIFVIIFTEKNPMQMNLQDRIRAAVMCSAAGDAIGYRNSYWEFCNSGVFMHEELYNRFGGLDGVCVCLSV